MPSGSTAGMPSSMSRRRSRYSRRASGSFISFRAYRRPSFGYEAHDVAGGAPIADLDQPFVLPFLQREVPGQGEQGRRRRRRAVGTRSA